MENTVNTSTEINLNVEKAKKKDKTAKIVKNVFTYIFLTIVAFFAFLPFYWMVITSVKTETEYRQAVPTFFPHEFKFQNYSFVLSCNDGLFGQMLLNTFIIGIVSTILGLIIIILTAYAFARIEFKGKDIVFAILLGTMMIPGEIFTTTNYITVSNFGWTETYIVMIAPFLVSIYYIFLMRNNFKQIPNSLYQAAKVDGTSEMAFLIKVMIPLTAPTLISVTLLKFIGTWNSYIWPRLVNTSESWQLISNWVSRSFTNDVNGTLYSLDMFGTSEPLYTVKMAAVCMVSLPLFLLFVFCRKYIMHGVSKSGTKG